MAVLQENMVVADRFRLEKMIGRGGMGSVWRAMHLGLDTPCAVKFIEGELANVAEAHARFEREAKAAAQLRSPNVVQIFDHGVWQGHPYIAMELLEGEDLGKWLSRPNNHGRLPASDVNFVVQNVCRALSRAHQAGVVHRDLKPDNIFIVKDDDRDIVKILDFGVAKSASQALDGSNTKTGAMLGTPYYMSPEQAQGIKSVDSRSDLWSLAVIVFQALTGQLPFQSEALGDLLVKIIVAPIPTPSVVYPMVPVGFDQWWAKAADRNPDNRYQTAKAFAEALTLSLGQSSVTDVMDRNRLHRPSERPGGATAMMVNAPGTEVFAHVPNTPHPGAHTAALDHRGTPNPAAQGQGHAPPMNTPQGMMNTPQGMMNTPQGTQAMPQMGPPMGPPPGHAGYPQQSPQNTTGNPVAATFSGMEGDGLPKKSAPVALLVGVGLLAAVGLGLGGFALVRGHGTAQGGGSDPTGSGSAMTASATSPPAGEASGAPVAKAGDPAADPATSASSAAAKDPAPVGSASASALAAAAPPPAGHRPNAGTGLAPVRPAPPPVAAAKPPPAPVTPPVTAAAAKPPAPKGPEKPINLGF